MSGRLSLRTRVLAGAAAIVVTLIAVAVAVTSLTRSHLVDQLDDELRAGMADVDGPPPPRPAEPPSPPAGYPVPELRVFDVSAAGEIADRFDVATAADESVPFVDESQLGEAIAGPQTVDGDGGDWRILARPATGDGFVVVARSLADVDATIARLVAIEVIATVVITFVLALVSWWVIRLGIRPVKAMTAAATTIAAGDLDQRIPDTAPGTEAGDLGVALNQMLERLESAFADREQAQERLQQFVADASHELRTPVTTIRGYAELHRLGGLADDTTRDEAMRRTEQEAIRMARLVDDMLTLAKLGAGRPLDRSPVDLSAIAHDATADARVVQPDRQITIHAAEPAIVAGDEDRLRQVVANLLGNALVHTPVDSPIEITVAATDDAATLAVVDHGPGMADDVAAKATERFYRADPSRSRTNGGSGLGLAIVDATVAAHGGSVVITSTPGSGTTVAITLPRQADGDQSTVGTSR